MTDNTYRPSYAPMPPANDGQWTVPMPVPPTISLRDWFAGMAMQGEMANPNGSGKIENIVTGSYRIADAMLKARGYTP